MKDDWTSGERNKRQRRAPDRIGAKGTSGARGTHAFAPDEKVIIYQLALCSRPFIEGAATIVAPVPGIANLYRVQFDGERRQLHRLVHAGAWQHDPDDLLVALLAHWRGAIDPGHFGGFATDVSDHNPEHRRHTCRLLGVKPE